MQLFGKHEQTDLLEDIGDCFIFLPFSSVSALEFTDYMAEAGMFI